MRTQMLSRVGSRVLGSMLVCCLWVFTGAASAKADTAWGNGACSVQQVTMGETTIWQIKATTSVTGLVPGNNPVEVTVKFQKKAAGGGAWTDISTVVQSTNGVGGTATIDTGFHTFTPAPAAGDQYRALFSGKYQTGPPPMWNNLTPVGSTPVTPVP